MTKKISSQKEFASIKSKFNSASDFRAFKKDYFFDPASRVELTGMQRTQTLRKKSGARWDIFGVFRTGMTIAEFNRSAKQVSSGAERDADVFIALYKGFICLI